MQSHFAAAPKRIDPQRKALLEEKIRSQLEQHDAVIIAHYYTAPEIQALAEATGGCVSDSLERPGLVEITPHRHCSLPVFVSWVKAQRF